VTSLHVFDGEATLHRPQILELLSELEERDLQSESTIQSVNLQSTGFQDPRGYSVVNPTGHDVGTVEDLYVDPTTRVPRYALLSFGKNHHQSETRHVLVDFGDVEVEGENEVRIKVSV
jgi:sporulation protein YlmC with PRC-barrel domain